MIEPINLIFLGCRSLFIAFTCFAVLIGNAAAAQPKVDCFDVSDDALRLARKLQLTWSDFGYGSGGGSPSVALRTPYSPSKTGATKAEADIRRILNQPALSAGQTRLLHADALKIFQILLRFGQINLGEYDVQSEKTARVNVTADHLRLQKLFNFIDRVDEDDFGVDAKRPYGDRQCWELDMADAIGVKAAGNDDTSCEKLFTKEQLRRLHTLHRSTLDFSRAILEHAALPRRKFYQDAANFGTWEQCEK